MTQSRRTCVSPNSPDHKRKEPPRTPDRPRLGAGRRSCVSQGSSARARALGRTAAISAWCASCFALCCALSVCLRRGFWVVTSRCWLADFPYDSALPDITASGPLTALPPGGERPCGLPGCPPPSPRLLAPAPPGNPRLGLRCRERPPSLRRHPGPHSAAQHCFLASVGLGLHAEPSQSTLSISLLSQPLAGCCSNCLFSCLSPLDCKAREGRVRVCRASSGGLSTFQGALHVVGIQGVLVK